MLLSELKDNGIDTKDVTSELIRSHSINIDVLKFICEHRPLEIVAFYQKLRENYNNKRSKLYKSIVQVDEKLPKDIVVTLASLLTQVLLYSNTAVNRELFLKHARADEISKVLANYFVSYDLTLCISLLNLIKADLKVLEEVYKQI